MVIFKKIIIVILVFISILLGILYYVFNAATYIEARPDYILAPKCGGKMQIDVIHDGYVWAIDDVYIPSWIDIEENERGFIITIDKNFIGKEKNGYIHIKSGKNLKTVEVKQKASVSYMNLAKDFVCFDENRGTEFIFIDTDGCNYKVVSCPDFVSAKLNEDQVIIKVGRNEEFDRDGYVVIEEDHLTRKILVKQEGPLCSYCLGMGEINCTNSPTRWNNGVHEHYSLVYLYTANFVSSYMSWIECSVCKGTGRVECTKCGGSGLAK